jgi:hypothetical protein
MSFVILTLPTSGVFINRDVGILNKYLFEKVPLDLLELSSLIVFSAVLLII